MSEAQPNFNDSLKLVQGERNTKSQQVKAEIQQNYLLGYFQSKRNEATLIDNLSPLHNYRV